MVPGGGSPTPPPASRLSMTRFAVWSIRHDKQYKTKDTLIKALHNYIWQQELSDGGAWFIAGDPPKPYLLVSKSHRLATVDIHDDIFGMVMAYKYGLIRTDNLTRHLAASLADYARAIGYVRDVRRFAYFNTGTHTLYISRYNGTCWRVTDQGWDVVPNGEGAIFLDDDGGKAAEDPPVGDHGLLLPALINGLNYQQKTDGGMLPHEQCLALKCWMFALAFPDLMRTKPLLLVEGAPGSGKTLAVQLIQVAIHGGMKALIVSKNDERDFGIHILRSPIALLDNVDNFQEWIADPICAYATTGMWTRRKLYTDDGQVNIRPHSFIAIASKNPVSFKRGDVMERIIPLRLEKRTINMPEGMLLAQIERDRPYLFGEYLYYCRKIIEALKLGVGRNTQTAHRMGDFASFAHAVGYVFGHSDDEVEEMLDALQGERETIVAEGDMLVDVLDRWLETTSNIGRSVALADLHKELASVAKDMQRPFYRSPTTLAQRISRDEGGLTKHFNIKTTTMQTKGNPKVYEIRRTD